MQKEGLRELFAELKITTSGSLKWDRRLGYIMILIGGGVLLLDPASLSSWLLVFVGLWVCLRPLWLPSLYDDLVLKSAGEETLDKHLLIGGYLAAYSILLITIGAVGLAVGGFGAGLFSFGIIGAYLSACCCIRGLNKKNKVDAGRGQSEP